MKNSCSWKNVYEQDIFLDFCIGKWTDKNKVIIDFFKTTIMTADEKQQ